MIPENFPRRFSVLAVLVIALAVVGLSFAQSLTFHRWFLVGTPLFLLRDADAATSSRPGAVALRKGHSYLIDLQADGRDQFTVSFAYQDGSDSRKFTVSSAFETDRYTANLVIKADHDDPAAGLVIDPAPGTPPQTLHLQRLDVSESSVWYYVFRALVRSGATAALLAAVGFLAWQWHRRQPAHPAAQSVRMVGCWTVLLLTVAGSFGVYFLEDRHAPLFRQVQRPSIYGWDESYYYFWLRSVMADGDVDFAKDLRYCNSMPRQLREDAVRLTPRTALGLVPNKYPVGWALLEAPFYEAADLSARVFNTFGGQERRDGWQPLYQAFLVAGQIGYALAGLCFAYKILAEFLPPALAACGVALGWLCSPLCYYQTLDVAMAHNVMFFAVTGAYYFTHRLRENPARLRNWVLIGLFCAFAILSRYQGAVMLLFPGVVCLQEVWKDFRRWTGLLSGIAASAVPLAVQFIAWKRLYGSWFLYTYEGEGFDWLHPHLYEALFSPHHGLFNWHPVVLVGFLGFAAWVILTGRRTEAVCFAASLVLTTYINAAWQCWWFGDAFGGRAFESCTLFVMLGLGFLLGALVRRPAAFQAAAAVLLLAGLWNMNLLGMNQHGLLSLHGPVTWQERAALAWDYWFGK